MIQRNSATCLKCGDEIESKDRWHFATCSCGNISVDGGKDYLRRVSRTDEWEETSIELKAGGAA